MKFLIVLFLLTPVVALTVDYLSIPSDDIIRGSHQLNDEGTQFEKIVRVDNDKFLDISRGIYADKFSKSRFGHNTAVPNGSFADIWSYGPTDALYNWPTTIEKFRIKAGGNVNDTSGGSGCRSVQVQYLDSVGDLQQEQLATAGASASASTSVTGFRFIRAWCDNAGTILSANTGIMLFENETTGEVVGEIDALKGQTEMSMYTVPRGFSCFLVRIEIDVASGSNKDADVIMWQKENALTFSAPFGVKRVVQEWDAVQGQRITNHVAYPKFEALTDIWLEGKGNGAITEVDIEYDLICTQD
jgi:hypothetical protein